MNRIPFGKSVGVTAQRDKEVVYQVTIAAKGGSLTYPEACMRAYLSGGKEPLMLLVGA